MMARTVAKLLYNKFPEIARKLPVACREIVQETLDEIDETVKAGMAASGGGRTYVRGGRIHTASAPGDMPAIDTSQLVSSLTKRMISGKARGVYFTDNIVGVYMEYGTARGIAPRPFMTPAAERARKGFMRKFKSLESRLR